MEPGTLLFAAVAFLLGIAVTAWRRRRRRIRQSLLVLPGTQAAPPGFLPQRTPPWPAPARAPAPARPRRRRLLADRSEARRAIVLMTVLGPCRAAEGWGRGRGDVRPGGSARPDVG